MIARLTGEEKLGIGPGQSESSRRLVRTTVTVTTGLSWEDGREGAKAQTDEKDMGHSLYWLPTRRHAAVARQREQCMQTPCDGVTFTSPLRHWDEQSVNR